MRSLTKEERIWLAKAIYSVSQKRKRDPLKYYIPQPYQIPFWLSSKKDKVILGGNKSGKTITGAAYVVKKLLDKPNQKWWAATWADLSVPVQQSMIYAHLPQDNRVQYAKFSEISGFANRIIIFANGSVLRFKTYNQGWKSFQGTARDGIWNDEEAPEDVVKEERIRLADNNGELVRTMTPLDGFTYTYTDVIEKGHLNSELEYWFWDSLNNMYVSKQVLERILGGYSVKEAEVRRRGLFQNLKTGRIYYAYNREIHKATEQFGIHPDFPIRLSFDFNVNPMVTMLFQIIPGVRENNEQDLVIKVIKVFKGENVSTRDHCKSLSVQLSEYIGKHELVIYGDATNQRRTEAADVNETNWWWVKNFFPPGQKITYKVPETNPNISERTSWVNAKIHNLDNHRGLLLNATGCEMLENDLEQCIWDKDKPKKDKKNPMLNHASDTLDYVVAKEFPFRAFAQMYQAKIAQLQPEQSTKRLSDFVMGQ